MIDPQMVMINSNTISNTFWGIKTQILYFIFKGTYYVKNVYHGLRRALE